MVTTPEGIVLAADSRQSYQNRKGMSRIGSDSAQKVFTLTDKVGLVVAGLAFLSDDGAAKNVSRFIEDFKRIHELKKLTVKQVADELHTFFKTKLQYKEELKVLPEKIAANLKIQGAQMLEHEIKDGRLIFKFKDPQGNVQQGVAAIDGLHFLVGGYNSNGSHMVCAVDVPGGVRVVRSNKKGMEYGANWIGQTDVVNRIVLGVDARIRALPFTQKAAQEISQEQVDVQLRGLEYVIQWGTMTLQDAVDFSRLAIETTTSIQRFSDGIQADPGDMPGVGGSVDTAHITPEQDFMWLSKKELTP
jgi:hypothetical protein